MTSANDLEHVDYERRGDVGIWRTNDFAALFESGEIADAEQHYRETATDDAMTGTVVEITNAGALGADLQDTLEHINEEWSELADEVGVERVAYVADGIMSWTVQSKIEADVETRSFDDIEDGVEWASG